MTWHNGKLRNDDWAPRLGPRAEVGMVQHHAARDEEMKR